MSWLPYLPDLALLALALLVLGSELSGGDGEKAFHLSRLGLVILAALLLVPTVPAVTSFAGYRISPVTQAWKVLFVLAALAVVCLSRSYFRPGGNARGALTRPGAYFGLVLLCTQGMFAIVSARDLLTFYLGLELATLPFFALAALQPHDSASAEAGSKYVLMGAFSSALTLFGLSFLFGCAGSLGYDALAAAAKSASGEPILWAGMLFVLGGLGFKLAMAPLHMWAPDVYEGAPTPVMAFLSLGSKAAGVAAVAVLFLGPLDAVRPALAGVFAFAAVLSMIVGNLGAMRQSNLRRFVAYSSIAQVGYMLTALLGAAEAARQSLQYNLLVYGATSAALYFIMAVIGKEGPETVPALRGLSRRHAGLAVLLVLCMFSLAGIPPLAGFLGKFMLFSAAAAQGHYVLVGLAVANAVVSFYYYMLLVKQAWIAEPDGAAAIALGTAQKLAMWGLGLALLVLGLCPAAMEWLASRGP